MVFLASQRRSQAARSVRSALSALSASRLPLLVLLKSGDMMTGKFVLAMPAGAFWTLVVVDSGKGEVVSTFLFSS
jgi:hypothetical protein